MLKDEEGNEVSYEEWSRDTDQLFPVHRGHLLENPVFWLVISILFWVVHAFASAGPSARWRGYERALARVLVAEADGSRSDWAALLWTLDHRLVKYGDTPARTMSYSVTTHSPLPRAQSIHLVAFGALDTESMRGKQMLGALEHVKAWMRGEVEDPCPEALHWRGTTDKEPKWFEPITCGTTNNIFGKVKTK